MAALAWVEVSLGSAGPVVVATGQDGKVGQQRVFGAGPANHAPTVTSTHPLCLPDGGAAETREAPSIEGASFIGSNRLGGRRGGQD